MRLLLFSALALFMFSCADQPSAESAQPQSQPTAAVDKAGPMADSMDVVSGATSVENNLTLNGTIEIPIQNNATISLPMDAIIRQANLVEGQLLAAGDVVATLENAGFIELQQSYLDATAQCEFLEAEYERQKNLSQEDATSHRRLQQSKADFMSMKSRKEAAGARLKMLGIDPSTVGQNGISPFLEIKAPISGYVSNVRVNQGKFLATGDAICEIVNKQQILIKLTAYEKDLDKLTLGKEINFHVNGLGDNTFQATITSIGQRVDRQNRSVEVYARSKQNNAQFRPGMYVSARIEN